MASGAAHGGGDKALVGARGLSVTYAAAGRRVHAVHDVGFDLRRGESMGVAGESACGKSTLGLAIMRMLGGSRGDGDATATALDDDCNDGSRGGDAASIADVSGTVLCDGSPILEMPESRFDSEFRWKKISMIFQGAMNSLDPVFTIREQFDEILARHGGVENAREAMADAVRSVNLDASVLDRYPHELSGGMKQRVVIAMALLLRPDLVIADEPTTALDVLVQAQIVSLLKSLKENGMSFILITHDLAVLSEIADVVGIMYGGQIVEFGSSYEVYRNPRHPYTQGLLDSIPTLRGDPPGYIRGSPPDLYGPPAQCRFIDRCPHAMEKCKTPPPKFATDTGYVMCWLEDGKGDEGAAATAATATATAAAGDDSSVRDDNHAAG